MKSPFWTYIADKLRFGLLDKPGSLQAIVKGTAHRFDTVREDAVFLRSQWFPQLCEPELVPEHGVSRGLVRHHTETPEQFRQRVINAYAWHMLGGKWKGLPQILRFYGFDVCAIEGIAKYQSSRWAEFQVGLHVPTSVDAQNEALANLETLVWLINEYKPARSVLARIYTDVYNITPLIWSEGQYSNHFYSHFSGVPAGDLGDGWKDDGLIISFGQRVCVQSGKVDFNEPLLMSGLQQTGFIAPYIDSPIWSQFCYSDSFPEKHGFTIGELLSVDWCVQTTTSHSWSGNWDNRHWAEISEWDRILPKWEMHHLGISRSQLVYGDELTNSEAGLWGGLNACYSVPTAILINNPPVWGEYNYSEDPLRQEITIHKQNLNQRYIMAEQAKLQDGCIAGQSILSMEAAPRHNRFWSGAWNSRRWSNDTAFMSVTSIAKES